MRPLGVALLAGTSVLALDRLYDWYIGGRASAEEPKAQEPKALQPGDLPLVDPQNRPGEVSLLDRGRTYAIRVMFDVREMARQMGVLATPGSIPDKEGAGRYIRAIFEKAGFKVLSEPVPRSEGASLTFHKGFPSEWVFTGQWQRSERIISIEPDVVRIFPSATFTLLPVA